MVYFSAGIFPTQGASLYALDPKSGKVIWVNDTACLNYVNIHMPSGLSFTGVAPQGYLVAHGDKLLVPTGRGLPGVFDRATGELDYHGNSAALRAGGSWVTGFDGWFVCADKAYDLATGMMRCADLGKLIRGFGTADKHAVQAPIPPGDGTAGGGRTAGPTTLVHRNGGSSRASLLRPPGLVFHADLGCVKAALLAPRGCSKPGSAGDGGPISDHNG